MRFHATALSTWLVCLIPASVQGGSSSSLRGRDLQAVLPTRWDACVKQEMSGEECEKHILSTMGGNVKNHQIPNLQIKQSPQRPAVMVAETKYMIGVPTNLFGETDCNVDEGIARVPWKWEASDGVEYTIPEVPCEGKSALACCESIKQTLIDQNIPLTNKDGQCFSCRVHQDPLEPRWDGQKINYVVHSYDINTQACVETLYTQGQVQQADSSVMAKLIQTRNQIHQILQNKENEIKCSDMLQLRNDIILYGRSFPKAASAIAGILCGECNTKNSASETIALTLEQHEALQLIHSEIANPIQSDTNEIIIYTDSTGDKVLKTPQVGGSVNDKDTSTTTDTGATGGDSRAAPCPVGQQPNGQGGCMCKAIETMAGNEIYWDDSFFNNRPAGSGCTCPSNMVEYDSRCYCAGGFKIWSSTHQKCVCPHGVEADGSCKCPGPFSGKDWNNVGWIKNQNGQGDSCVIDFDCTQSGYDYYSNFEDGCNRCKWGYVLVNGQCERECDQSNGFIYNKAKDKCVCKVSEQVEFYGKCICPQLGATVHPGKDSCECTHPEVMHYDEGSKSYFCRIKIGGGGGNGGGNGGGDGPPDINYYNYYNYNNYY